MRIFISITVILFFTVTANGQNPTALKKHGNIWYFGMSTSLVDGPGLDFTSGSPVVLNNGRYLGAEGPATICDSTGNLRFYTNSHWAYNSLHDTMSNAAVIAPGGLGWISSSQGSLIVPKPGSNEIYYLFVANAMEVVGWGLRYSVIDMTLDGGLGAITAEKNVLLFSDCGEKQTAVHHANCTDVWIMAHRNETNHFYAYLLTDTGMNTTPVISAVGVVTTIAEDGTRGHLKFSPNGKKLAMTTMLKSVVQLYDFDNATGIVSNPITLPPDSHEYGACFSPNSSKLYVAGPQPIGGQVVQYDLSIPDSASIAASKTYVGIAPVFEAFFSPELAPDGKIYIAKFGSPGVDSLAVIHNPDQPGLSCNFQDKAIWLGANDARSGTGLNNLVQSYFNTDPTAYNCENGIDNLLVNTAEIKVLPNPLNKEAKVIIRNTKGLFKDDVEINIYDALGHLCFSERLAPPISDIIRFKIQKGALTNGLYFLEVISGTFHVLEKVIMNN